MKAGNISDNRLTGLKNDLKNITVMLETDKAS